MLRVSEWLQGMTPSRLSQCLSNLRLEAESTSISNANMSAEVEEEEAEEDV